MKKLLIIMFLCMFLGVGVIGVNANFLYSPTEVSYTGSTSSPNAYDNDLSTWAVAGGMDATTYIYMNYTYIFNSNPEVKLYYINNSIPSQNFLRDSNVLIPSSCINLNKTQVRAELNRAGGNWKKLNLDCYNLTSSSWVNIFDSQLTLSHWSSNMGLYEVYFLDSFNPNIINNTYYNSDNINFSYNISLDNEPFEVFQYISNTSNPTQNNGTVSGGVTIDDGAMVFDGVDDVITIPHTTLLTPSNLANGFSISVWIKPNSTGEGGATGSGQIIAKGPGDTGFQLQSRQDIGKINFYLKATNKLTEVIAVNFGVWTHYIITVSGANPAIGNMYKNGVQTGSVNYNLGQSVADITNVDPLCIGNIEDTSKTFDGSISNVSIFNKVLSQSEITEIYNAGKDELSPIRDGLVLELSGKDFVGNYTNPITITDTSPYSYINYFSNLYNSTIGSYFGGLAEQVWYTAIKVKDSISNIVQSFWYTFTVDTTNPVINNSLPIEWNSYNINLSEYIFCSEIGIGYCNITFNLDNVSIAVNSTSYDFTYNGNQSYTITAVDSAGNTINETGTILVNPFGYFYFNHSTLLSNFTFNDVFFNSTEASFKLYNDGLVLGNNTLEWSRLGYITQNIIVEVTNTSSINTTYNVSPAVINVNIYDKTSLALITGVNFSLTFIGSVGAQTSTTTGKASITNSLFLDEQYSLLVASADYETERSVFTFSNKENKTLNVYMSLSNATNLGYVQIKVVDLVGKNVNGAIVQALQWDTTTSSYIKVSETITSEDGIGILNIILNDKFYIFRAVKEGNSADSVSQIITTIQNGKVIFLTLESTESQIIGLLQGVTTEINESFNAVTNISSINLSWSNEYGGALTACLTSYRVNKLGEKTELQSYCSAPSSSGLLEKQFAINSEYDIQIIATLGLDNGVTIELQTFTYYSSLSLNVLLLDYGLQYFVLIIIFILAVVIMLESSMVIGATSLMVMTGVSLWLIPTIMSTTIVMFIFVLCIGIIIASVRSDK